MCTRYYMEMSPELKPYVDEAKRSALGKSMIIVLGKPLKTEGEIRPTDMVPVIAPNKKRKAMVFPMVWGFDIKGLDRPVLNARVETAKDKASFRDAWKMRRCIIPASYYFEWDHNKNKYAIQPPGASVTYLAGLYQMQEYRGLNYPVFTVLTREPSEELSKIHDRMPLILPETAIGDWINPDGKPEEVVNTALTEMIAEKENKYEQLTFQ